MYTNMLLVACTNYYFIDMAFHRARRIFKQASFRLVHMHETQRAHVEHCYKEKSQTERSLFKNSSSSVEGHINKVIFSTCTLTCFEWQLQLMKLRCCFKIVRDQGRIQEFGRGGSNNYIHKGAEPQKPTPFYYIKLKILHKHVQQI